MRKIYLVVAAALLFCTAACASNPAQNSAQTNSNVNPQISSDRGQATLQLEGGKVVVEYGRPALKGRDLEKMISPGQEWRMGSNAATTLTTDVDLKFGDTLVSKGDYVLKAKLVEPQRWHMLVLTRDEAPVAEIPLSFQKADRSAELMTIELEGKSRGGRIILHWGELMLSSDFERA